MEMAAALLDIDVNTSVTRRDAVLSDEHAEAESAVAPVVTSSNVPTTITAALAARRALC